MTFVCCHSKWLRATSILFRAVDSCFVVHAWEWKGFCSTLAITPASLARESELLLNLTLSVPVSSFDFCLPQSLSQDIEDRGQNKPTGNLLLIGPLSTEFYIQTTWSYLPFRVFWELFYVFGAEFLVVISQGGRMELFTPFLLKLELICFAFYKYIVFMIWKCISGREYF